ncbi:MAG: exosome complex protein Rrp42 [Thaumarchaeota archaeon]|nr:exosome complex protein Rrp42 [Nitrososphaerota archaeon]
MTELLSKGNRLSGRGLLEYRPIKIETGLIEKASGSAKVSIGNSQVIAGVKVEMGTPFPDTPNQGLLVVNTEVLPISSRYAEPGPPSEDAIELARVVDRGIRESKMIDLQKLCLIPGKKVLAVFIDVSVLDIDGNLFDTISYACTAALATAKIVQYEVSGEEIKASEEKIPLPVKTIPISITMARIHDALIVDPDLEEEAVMDARLTLATDSDGNICAGQKGCPGGFTVEQIMQAKDIAIEKGKENRELLKKMTGIA